jgi:hypothetical protein
MVALIRQFDGVAGAPAQSASTSSNIAEIRTVLHAATVDDGAAIAKHAIVVSPQMAILG